MDLFDVRALINEGLDDARSEALPLLMAQEGAENGKRLVASTAGAIKVTHVLPRSGMVAAAVHKKQARRLGTQLKDLAGSGAKPSAIGAGMAGVSHVWLDRKATVTLDRNIVQIGAPQAWSAGYTGSGVKIAVLDTGYDPAHPDLVGRVSTAADFSGKGSPIDGHGHGTHVAAVAAGSGAASGGQRRGIAPDATLIVGKVLGDTGSGPISNIMAGMEWAVAQGADVVNMSLGAAPTDGSDPLSRAVNELTKRGTLFVISAGNSGANGPKTVGSPGTAEAALTVAAVDGADTVAPFSSRGPRLDGALKPDIAAPGVSIIAARAAGTSMGTPVDDRYTSASGTSMAAPHVAGAAALLVQRHADWTPELLKAALAGTADPRSEVGVFDQGAGRIDIAEAIDATVVPEDEDVDLGLLTFPQTGVIQKAVGWRNEAAEPVVLNFSLDLYGPDGTAVPDSQAWLSVESATVPAHGRAEVTLNVDARHTQSGQHTGYLTAAVAGTDRKLQTPVGFTDEQEMYQLTVRGTNRAGQPVDRSSRVSVININGATPFSALLRPFDDTGVLRLRVPRQRFHAEAHIQDYTFRFDNAGVAQDRENDAVSVIQQPEILVDGDTTVDLDARTGVGWSTTLEGTPTEVAERAVDTFRWDNNNNAFRLHTWTNFPGSMPTFFSPQVPTTVGRFEAATTDLLIKPRITLEVGGRRVKVALDRKTPLPNRGGRFPVVDLAAGTESDFADKDVHGKIVVVRRGQPLPQVAARAKTAGAVLLAITNDRPGIFQSDLLFTANMPAVIVDGGDAAMLHQATGDYGWVTIIPDSPVNYRLHRRATGGMPQPADKRYSRQEINQLARLDTHYHHPAGSLRSNINFADAFGDTYALVGSRDRVEYFTAGVEAAPSLSWIYPPQSTPGGPQGIHTWTRDKRVYRPGERDTLHWLRAPLRPGLGGLENVPVSRTATTLTGAVTDVTDADGARGHITALGGLPQPTHLISLYRDNTLVGQAATRSDFRFPVTTDRARYRLVTEQDTKAGAPLNTRRTATWDFTSEKPAGNSQVLPLPVVDFNLDCDSTGRLTDRKITLRVMPQAGTASIQLHSLAISVSPDKGVTWQTLKRHHSFEEGATFELPKFTTGQILSFRIQATTSPGDVRHEETIIQAIQVR
ncbi:S8 family serine peptidase [Micromonospora sp. NPDC047707]|uniref:S8 family serine peptidase n=1 Tax=Micromonospora sp. NPDC047707 TaxID=3154498 RepID=UPI0034546F8D